MMQLHILPISRLILQATTRLLHVYRRISATTQTLLLSSTQTHLRRLTATSSQRIQSEIRQSLRLLYPLSMRLSQDLSSRAQITQRLTRQRLLPTLRLNPAITQQILLQDTMILSQQSTGTSQLRIRRRLTAMQTLSTHLYLSTSALIIQPLLPQS